jgi:hypothetical protein
VETCTVETGLLRKKPCGQLSITKCANCEQPLCGKHAIAQLSTTGRKTGKFLCADCNAAQRQYEETAVPAPATPAKPADKRQPEPGAATAHPKPAATPAPATKPAPAAPAAPAKPPEENSDGSIDFTPTKK